MAEGGDFFANHGRGRGLPHGKPTEREPLRRPRCATNDRTTGSKADLGQQCNAASSVESLSTSLMNDCRVTDAHKTYTLSPAAKEFVPRNCHTIATHIQPVYHQSEEVEDNDEVAGVSDDFLIDQLTVILDHLARSPGNFDALASDLLNLLTTCASGLNTITVVVNTIFDRSVIEMNLRYNGARLCNYLSQNVLTETEDKTFRQLLLQKCQAEADLGKIRECMNKSEQSTWVHGLAHFLGELFIHLELGTEGRTARATVLGVHLCNFLSLLLDHRTEGNLKCVGQVLKFAGGAMEDEQRKSKNTAALDNLMLKINDITRTDTQLSKNMREMFLKVVELRASNWGRVVTSPIVREEPFVGDVPCGDVVLYGPDGQPLTLEESAFLESASYLYYNTEDECGDFPEYNSQGEGWSTEDDQMDDEMSAAYEEFLAQQGPCYNPPHL